jgi:hypothetical protein
MKNDLTHKSPGYHSREITMIIILNTPTVMQDVMDSLHVEAFFHLSVGVKAYVQVRGH